MSVFGVTAESVFGVTAESLFGVTPGWTFEVDPGSDGQRLDRFIASRVPRLSRARAARLDVVDLDAPDRVLRKSSKVRAGQRLFAHRPMPDADAEVPEPAVIHEDAELLVLDKPPGLAVHPTATRYRTTVTHWLQGRGLAGRAHPVHRLDVESSGVLVCAKTVEVERALVAAFAERRVQKRYLAIVSGVPPESWTDDTSLGFDPNAEIHFRMGPGDLPAKTGFERLSIHGARSLVQATPLTGRQHQIRVHLALAGHPIVGDKLYIDEALFLAHTDEGLDAAGWLRLGHHRHALHAHRLQWGDHVFESPLPADLQALLEDGR